MSITVIKIQGISPPGAYVPCCNAALSFGFESPPVLASKPDIPPDQSWRVPMKKMFLATFTVLGLAAAAALAPVAASAHVFHNGSSVAGDATITRMEQTGAIGGN
jgi:hypothetical protein